MSDDLTSELRYHVVLLGPERGLRKDEFLKEFNDRVRDLGLDADQHTTVSVGLPTLSAANLPLIAVVWCGSAVDSSDAERAELTSLRDAGVSIFPAVESRVDYPDKVPELLGPINGLEWNEINKLVTSVLESFGLLRTGKRVFVSYRRNEAQAVADQLFERLQRRGYHTFLDTACIEPGRDVQGDLKSQLANIDVVVLLHTENALGSTWVLEEVLDAQRRGTEVFDLLWPKDSQNAAAPMGELAFAISETLERSCFENPDAPNPATRRLTEAFLDPFIVRVERARIRSVRTRRDRVLRQLAEDASLAGLQFQYFATGHCAITSVPFVGFGPHGSDEWQKVVIISHGTPGSIDLYRGQHAAGLDSIAPRDARIVYDDFGLLEEELAHLDWLNSSIASRSRIMSLRLGMAWEWLCTGGSPS